MYEELIVALDTAGKNSTALTVITGAGDYYCSGNDLDNFASIPPSEMQKAAVDGGELLRCVYQIFIYLIMLMVCIAFIIIKNTSSYLKEFMKIHSIISIRYD